MTHQSEVIERAARCIDGTWTAVDVRQLGLWAREAVKRDVERRSTPKTLMTDAEFETLRNCADFACRGSLNVGDVARLGKLATTAADTIAALQEQNRGLVERCQAAEVDATSWRNFGDAAGVLKREAETLAKSVNADEYAAAIDAMQKKAQRWDAAQAAGALDGDTLIRIYETACRVENAISLNYSKARAAGDAAIVAHVRAHDAALREAPSVSLCCEDVGSYSISVGLDADGSPRVTVNGETFVRAMKKGVWK